MRRREPTATERRLNAIHESDKSLTILIAPILTALTNIVALLWFAGMAISLANMSEGVILFSLAAIPVLLFWLLGRVVHRAAAKIRAEREWKKLQACGALSPAVFSSE